MRDQNIESLLFSYNDWKSIVKKWPYCFEIEKNRQTLFYFGANHSHNLDNEQFPILREFWKKFLEKTDGKNAVVFVEGGVRKIAPNEETAILDDSEAGLATYLANEKRIFVHSPEPDRRREMNFLAEKFSKEEVALYYFTRVVHGWNRRDPKPDFEEYINKFLSYDKERSDWTDFDFSVEHLKSAYKMVTEIDFDKNDDEFLHSLINPTIENSVINKVARACSTYRNIHIVSEILRFWKDGKNIFIVFGGAHAVIQEPALKKILS